MDFKQLGKNILENAVASTIVVSSGIGDSVKFPNNEAGLALKNGAIMTLSEQILEMYNKGSTKLDRQDYLGLIDDVIFNGSAFYGLQKSNLASTVVRTLNDLSPLDNEYNERLASGALLAAIATARDIIDNSPNLSNTPLRYLTHPTRLIS